MIPEEDYSYAGGVIACAALHPLNKKKREECKEDWQAGKADTSGVTEAEFMAEMMKEREATRRAELASDKWSPLAVTGVVAGSMISLAVMIAIIVKVRKKKKQK